MRSFEDGNTLTTHEERSLCARPCSRTGMSPVSSVLCVAHALRSNSLPIALIQVRAIAKGSYKADVSAVARARGPRVEMG